MKNQDSLVGDGSRSSSLICPPLLSLFVAFIRPLIDKYAGETTGITMDIDGVILALGISISTLVTGIVASRRGERSWALWLGFIPAILIAVFWVTIFIGELLYPH